METEVLQKNILRILLYYDIFRHPLKMEEIFTFLPENSIQKEKFVEAVYKFSRSDESKFSQKDGYVYVKPNSDNVTNRIEKEKYSQRMWKAARLITHVIKRFPFVRAIMVTGSLSKNSSNKSSDIDYMIITKSNRLWVSRTLLMLFKKIFLFNSYKFFCINYFITEDKLETEEKNIFTATEIATVKCTYNTGLMNEFLKHNEWIKEYFPNYKTGDPILHFPEFKLNNRESYFQRMIELFFAGKIGDYLEKRFREMMIKYRDRKYKYLEESERLHRLKFTDKLSKAHPEDVQEGILEMYNKKLREYNCI